MKNITWYIIAGLIIIGGVWWYLASKPSSQSDINSTTNSTNTSSDTTGTLGMKTTLGGIFDDPGSHECDYNQVSPQSRSTNAVYIANGKLRGEFRTQTATSSTLSMIVYDGTYLYTWTEGQTTGKISQPKTLKDLPGIIPEDITSGRILGAGLNNVSWDCHDWSKDLTKLVRPSYVKFN